MEKITLSELRDLREILKPIVVDPNEVTVEDLIGEAPANGHIAKWEATTATETRAKPATVTEAELFNEALSSLREIVRDEAIANPVRLEAIRFQLKNSYHLSEEAKRVE